MTPDPGKRFQLIKAIRDLSGIALRDAAIHADTIMASMPEPRISSEDWANIAHLLHSDPTPLFPPDNRARLIGLAQDMADILHSRNRLEEREKSALCALADNPH